MCSHKVIAGGTGYKLVCKNGEMAACPVVGTTTTTTITPPLLGPAFPPPNGNVSFAFAGNTIEFTNFVPDTTWSELYWGPSSAALPTAGLDGSPHALTFSGIAGTTATWAGTTDWTDPMDSTT